MTLALNPKLNVSFLEISLKVDGFFPDKDKRIKGEGLWTM